MQLHNHNPQQVEVLTQILNTVIGKMLAVEFGDPAQDQRMIRHHAHLRGQYDTLLSLIQDNYEAPEPIPQPELNFPE